MADKKKKDALSGVKMAMALDNQSARDLALLKKRAKKPKIARVKKQQFNIQKPGAFGIQRNDIMKARFGGKVIQKMQSGGRKLSEEELEAAIREIEEQGTVFGKGSGLSKDQTKKIADSFEKSFNDIFGKKFGGVIRKMRGGGLMEAIKKVKAKEMQGGGSVGDKLREEVSKSRKGKIGGSISMKEMDRIMRKVGIDSGLFEKPVKKQEGGNIPKPKMRPKNLKKKDPFRADKTESLNKEFSKKVAKINQENMKNVKSKKVGGLIGGQVKLDKNKDGKISGEDFAMMEMGGKVEKYGAGGNVKGGKMGCRGMGAALRGGGFSIR
jgi:hypothetical protein